MPIYEFHCIDCDRSFETLVRGGHVTKMRNAHRATAPI